MDSAFDLLADWDYQSCGSVSFSSLEHPKFSGLSRKEFLGPRLDLMFDKAKRESEAFDVSWAVTQEGRRGG